MKTREQIINWLKSQEWYKEFCEKAGFCCEEELSEYIQSRMDRPKYIISAAFVWPEMERDFWCDRKESGLTKYDGPFYVHDLQHALRLVRLNEIADNLKI